MSSSVSQSITPEPAVKLQHYFSMVPEALTFDPNLSAWAVRVFTALHRYGQDPSSCYPKYCTLAERLGTSKTTVRDAVRELEKAGWVQRFPRYLADGSQTSNGFLLIAVLETADTEMSTEPPSEYRPPSAGRQGPCQNADAQEREPVEREPSFNNNDSRRVQQRVLKAAAVEGEEITEELEEAADIAGSIATRHFGDPPSGREVRETLRALTAGWTPEQLDTLAADAVAADNIRAPHGWYVSRLANYALTPPASDAQPVGVRRTWADDWELIEPYIMTGRYKDFPVDGISPTGIEAAFEVRMTVIHEPAVRIRGAFRAKWAELAKGQAA